MSGTYCLIIASVMYARYVTKVFQMDYVGYLFICLYINLA